ncbi:MAG: spondin domain-containing protein [Granulosicoccus sp.]
MKTAIENVLCSTSLTSTQMEKLLENPMCEFRRQACLCIFLFLLVASSFRAVNAASQQATYKMDLSIEWSQNLAPFEFPDGAHMSSLIGLTHQDRYRLFEDGATASSGLELVAENGRFGILRAQFEELGRKQRVGTVVMADGIKKVPGKISTTFTSTTDHPLLSVITMLAPSPDWFTGVSGVSLFSDGEWVDEINLPLWVWDAGTDSGVTFKSDNEDTQPRESIRLLSTEHFLNNQGLMRFGSISITRQH